MYSSKTIVIKHFTTITSAYYGHSVGILSSSTKIPQSYFSKDADTMGILLVQTPCHGTVHGLTSGFWYTKRSLIGRVRYSTINIIPFTAFPLWHHIGYFSYHSSTYLPCTKTCNNESRYTTSNGFFILCFVTMSCTGEVDSKVGQHIQYLLL